MVKGNRLCLLASGALVAAMTLWGCGGGGGGGGDTVAATTKGESGRLTQGPVLNATVFADNIAKGVRFSRDSDEVWTTTDSVTGDFTLPTKPTYNYVLVSQGGTDKLTGQGAMQMMAPAGSANVTPLTTLVALDTSGTVLAKLEALMPAGAKFDTDISVVSSPAALLVAKSVEAMVATLTNAITDSASAGGQVVSPAQVSAIQAQALQSITQEFAEVTTTAASLAVPDNLATALASAAVATVASVNTSGNITVPADTASDAAESAVAATATLLVLDSNESATVAAVTGGEAAAMGTRVAAFNTAVNDATTTAAADTEATTTLASYVPPPIQVVTPITVAPPLGSQTISNIGFSPAVLNIGSTITVVASASSGLPVSYSSATPAVCSVSGSTVTGLIDGMCIVTAIQAGNSSYSAEMVQAYVTVRANQTIGAITATPATLQVGETATLAAAASSGQAVSFTSKTPTVCTVAAGMVTGVAAGSCTVAADQIGDSSYVAAPQVNQNITVVKNTQVITVTSMPPTGVAVGNSFTVVATAPGGPVVYSTGTPSICANVAGGPIFTVTAAGDCVVNYNQSGNNIYAAAPQISNSTSAIKQNQTISYDAYNPATVYMGVTYDLVASVASSLPLTFTSNTPGVCTFSGNTLTPVASGSCQFDISQAGDTRYNPAVSSAQSLTVVKKPQAIIVSQAAPATALVGENFTVLAAAPGGAVSYSVATPGVVCTALGNQITMVASGTCQVLYNQAGGPNYSVAPQISNNVVSSKINQTIGVIGHTAVSGNASTLSATAYVAGTVTPSALAVTFGSATPTICSVSGSVATIVASGTCTVTANQAGNTSYHPAPSRFLDFDVTYTPPVTGGTGGTGGGI